MSQDRSIQTLRIHQFAGITAKMGKDCTVDEAVVGKNKRNLICSRSVVLGSAVSSLIGVWGGAPEADPFCVGKPSKTMQ